ncbi:MAG: TetR/AcrR family transcriptional regulator [Anaerolineales bacterium]
MPKQTFLNLPEDKRRKIVEAAIDEFSAFGLENASTNRIVAASGISKGSFYQYFDDKRDVFIYLMRVIEDEKKAFFRDRHPPSTALDTFGYFRWMIKTGMEFNSAYPRLNLALVRVLFTEGLYFGPLFADLRQRTVAALTAMVNQAKERGELDPQVDVPLAVLVMETWSNAITMYIMREIQQQEDVMGWIRLPETQNKIEQLLYVMEYGLRNTTQERKDS